MYMYDCGPTTCFSFVRYICSYGAYNVLLCPSTLSLTKIWVQIYWVMKRWHSIDNAVLDSHVT